MDINLTTREEIEFKVHMNKYECLVKRGNITEKIIRYFSTSEHAFAWLELEGYKVLSVKLI